MTDTVRSGTRTRVGAARKPTYAKWTKAFLAHLANTSNVTESARKAKVALSTAYETRRAKPEFNRRWQAALLEGYEHLELELLQRLRAGEVKDPADPAPKKKTAFDNATAFRLLSLHREMAARQRALQDDDNEEAVLAALDAKLERMRQRQLDGDGMAAGAPGGSGGSGRDAAS